MGSDVKEHQDNLADDILKTNPSPKRDGRGLDDMFQTIQPVSKDRHLVSSFQIKGDGPTNYISANKEAGESVHTKQRYKS